MSRCLSASASAAVAALLAAGCGSTPRPAAAPTTAPGTTAPATTARATPPPAAPERVGVADIVARVLPSVVNVRASGFDGSESEGSGVVIDPKGIIVTNNHVIEAARSVTVVVNDPGHPKPLSGQVIGTAPERDLAIIRVEADDLVPVRLGRSSRLRLGDGVLAIGFPLDLGGPTVTEGIVSGLNRTIRPTAGPALEGLLQTDAAINPGNSGGALVDLAGRLVGINTAAAQAGLAENVGFAIAIDEARPVIDEIRHRPPDQRVWLGVALDTVGTPVEAAQLGLDPSVRGAVVTSVYVGGPAAAAGLREGDVVVAADGRAVRSSEDLAAIVGKLHPGDRITLDVVDDLGPRRARVRVARRPATLSG